MKNDENNDAQELLERIIQILYPTHRDYVTDAELVYGPEVTFRELVRIKYDEGISIDEAKSRFPDTAQVRGVAAQEYERGRSDAADYLAWEVVDKIENLLAKSGRGPLAKLIPVIDRLANI